MWCWAPRRGGKVLASSEQGMLHQWKWAGQVDHLAHFFMFNFQAASTSGKRVFVRSCSDEHEQDGFVCRCVCLPCLLSCLSDTALSVQQQNHGGWLTDAHLQVHQGDGGVGGWTLQPQLAHCWRWPANQPPSKTRGGRKLCRNSIFSAHWEFDVDWYWLVLIDTFLPMSPSFQCYQCDSTHENCSENQMGDAVFCGDEMNGCLISRGSSQWYKSDCITDKNTDIDSMITNWTTDKSSCVCLQNHPSISINVVSRVRPSRQSFCPLVLDNAGGGSLCG